MATDFNTNRHQISSFSHTRFLSFCPSSATDVSYGNILMSPPTEGVVG